MNIVKNVRVGSVNYDVTVKDETVVLNTIQCKGMIDYDFHHIKIDSSIQDAQGQEQTFLHELVHAIIKERNLDMQNNDEESIVDEIALGLHQVIKDNPDIFKIVEC